MAEVFCQRGLASLDTPAANIPTWALLFTPLPDPGAVGAAGTGYNVAISGYGRHGTGTSGSSDVDFRRRSAENMLGALTDLEAFESFQFGADPNGLKQNLYFLDFDDPLRGKPGESRFDFNAFRDVARTKDGVPSEGSTAPGDSGGPLILQNFTKQVVIGVLSGSYSGNFGPDNGYGEVSFYQPLYLYWDWVAANNPYRYASAKDGDGSWTDPNHWLTTLDPAYTILSDGALVNGVPTAPGEQKNGTSGDFGQTCVELASADVYRCQDLATDTIIDTRPTAATDSVIVDQAATLGGTVSQSTVAQSTVSPRAGAAALPATLDNGLPGATGFVPNNVAPVRTTAAQAKYYDVTLTADGTTELSGADVTIERLTIGTAKANLVVAGNASLTILMESSQFAGTNTVNGTLTSVGDYSLLGGALFGSGRINAPFVTSVTGQIIPGTMASIGTLTFGGNLIMSSATGYLVNLGPNGSSDRISVVANGESVGVASIGGVLGFSPVSGTTVRYGDRYTILSAEGGVTGEFSTLTALSAILRPTALYSANTVEMLIDAVPYSRVVSSRSLVQVAYAQLLDANRATGNLSQLYDVLDLQPVETIHTTLDSLAPRTETLRSAMASAALDNNSRLIRHRLGALNPKSFAGTVAYIGRPMTAQSNADNSNLLQGGGGGMAETRTAEGRLPETLSAFLAGGHIDGESRSMAAALPQSGHDQFDGWYLAGGIEAEVGKQGLVGFALSYTNLDGKTAGASGSVQGSLIQGTVYTKHWFGAVYGEAQLSAGQFKSDATRNGNLPGSTYALRSRDEALSLAAELNVGATFGNTIKAGPRIGLRGGWMDFGRSVETGGPTALVYNRVPLKSLQGRVGFLVNGVGKIQPNAAIHYIHEFSAQPTSLAARFVGGLPDVDAVFALAGSNAGSDMDWFEASAGLTLATGNIALSLSTDTTIGRDDIRNQAYRASVRVRF